MKKLFLTLSLALIVTLSGYADQAFRNHRYDAFKVLNVDTTSVLFVGNSITNMHEWWEALDCQQNILNRGNSGGYTQEVIDNLDGYLAGKPKAIFLMIGTNDLGTSGLNTTTYVVNNMKTIMDKVTTQSPETKLYVQSILPSNNGLRTTTLLGTTNDSIKALIARSYPTVTYVDLWDDLYKVASVADGNLTVDGLHLKAAGYRIWLNKILPLVQLYCPDAKVVYPDNTATLQNMGGLSGSWGMRVTHFSLFPVHSDDILIVGDELAHSGEWHELLGSAHIKNRGLGWGIGSCTIAQANSEMAAILNGRTSSTDNEAPAQIYLYIGYSDIVANGTGVATAITNYKTLITTIRKYAPKEKTKIYVMAVVPNRNEGTNNKILSFNYALKSMASDLDGVEYVNTYTPLMDGTSANTDYIDANGYLSGNGYVKVANILAETMSQDAELSPITNGTTTPLGHLLPQPQQYTLGEGTIDTTGITTTITMVSSINGAYDYSLPGYDNESYQLDITKEGINIQAVSETGVIRAKQTLDQLVEEFGTQVPCVSITDWPAFKLRGLMHDIGRSFISIDELKHEIELLARFKLNTFHWHLTDNQGFRFESKLYPQLNAESSFTRFAGKYYTQEQCTELEAFAHERGVNIIPEIDMPGHSTAFQTAMGFTMSSDQGKVVLKNLLKELGQTFPLAPYIHIGADEAGTTAAFVNEMTQFVRDSLNRKTVVWNPISGVSISTSNLPYTDMTSMWSTSGRKISGIPNIDSRYNYINHYDVFADLVGLYKSNVYYQEKGDSEVAGAMTAVWNDRKTATQEDIIKQNNVWANALATTERCWKGGGKQYIEAGGTVLPNSGTEYEEFKDFEDRLLWHKAHSLSAEPIPYVKQTNVRWKIALDGDTIQTTGAGIYLRHTWGSTVPSCISNPQLGQTAYAWTYVYSPEDQKAGALIEFQNYGRSENDYAPEKGCWDRKGSKIWLNDEELLPPTWTNTGVAINSEVDLGNENFTARDPEIVTLKKGWNKVLLKLPYASASNVRLNKWMYTFVLTDSLGRNALDNVVYSPNQYTDESAETVAAKLTELNTYVNAQCGDAIGYYPTSLATDIRATLNSIKATLTESLTEEQREAQLTQLDEALEQFMAVLATASINQPSLDEYYTLSDKRLGYYATSQGLNANMIGSATTSAQAIWKFELRSDGTYNLRNYANQTFISPTSSNNTALTTVSAEPSAGWKLLPSDNVGYVIIVSGTTQFNQTQTSLSYALYNWGSGTNTSDTGCQYLIRQVTDLPELDENGNPVDTFDGKILTFTNIQQDGTEKTLMVSTTTNQLTLSKYTPERIGQRAQFLCEKQSNGKYTLYNDTTGYYMIWKGNSNGYNNDKGILASYESTYCDWTIIDASSTLEGTYYLVGKRSNGTTDGSLIISSAGKFDAYGATVGYSSTYSNLFRIGEVTRTDGLTTISATATDIDAIYDLTGRRVKEPAKGVYICEGRKLIKR